MTALTEERATVALRPRFEGANIRTWVGFKHFMYLVEDAVLEWFRARGFGPASLFHERGLTLSIVDCSVQLPAVLGCDDVVDADVVGGPSQFSVRLRARRPGAPTVLRGRVSVVLVAAGGGPAPDLLTSAVGQVAGTATAPAGVATAPLGSASPADRLRAEQPGAFLWSWRVPYYYCQFSEHIQHSGYVRALEEVVERFLAERGLSVGTMLAERAWIPVVSRAQVTQLTPVRMEEMVHTGFEVTDVLGGVGFDARMTCYVNRDGALVPAAVARILHAYAIARGPRAGTLATLDDATVAALTRAPSRPARGGSLTGAGP